MSHIIHIHRYKHFGAALLQYKKSAYGYNCSCMFHTHRGINDNKSIAYKLYKCKFILTAPCNQLERHRGIKIIKLKVMLLMNAEEWLLSIRGLNVDSFELRWLYYYIYDDMMEKATSTTVAPVRNKVQQSFSNHREDAIIDAVDYSTAIKERLDETNKRLVQAFWLIEKIPRVKPRMLLRMYYLEGLTWQQTAERLNMTVRYVSGNLKKKAIAMFEKILIEEGILEDVN